MDICFVIVQDQSLPLDDAKALLRTAGFPDLHIWPINSTKIVKSWEDAFKMITQAKTAGFDPRNDVLSCSATWF